MTIPWQFFITVSIVAYSIAVVVQRVILKEDKTDPIISSVVFQLLAGVLIGLYGFTTGTMAFPQNIVSLLPNLALTAILWGFANIFIFISLKSVESSEFTILFSTRALFTILTALIFLNETFTTKQIFGTALIFLAVALVTLKKTKFKFSKGELFAILGAATMGIAITNDGYLLRSFALYPYVTLNYLLPAILVGFFYANTFRKSIKHMNALYVKRMLAMSLLSALAALTFFKALQLSRSASQVSTVNLIAIILTVLLGIIFLKERGHVARKLIGAVLSVIGAMFLIG